MARHFRQLELLPKNNAGEAPGEIELRARHMGLQHILGIDEAGRGPLAGPVVAAAVMLPEDYILKGLTDSKLLTGKQRERLFPIIKKESIAWAAAFGSSSRIDEINVLAATLESMENAARLARMRGVAPDLIVVDGNRQIESEIRQWTVVGGDRRCLAVAAASIIAKVLRDHWMIAASIRYPGYDFERHKGYGTALHKERIAKLGPCPIHRKSFRGVREWLADPE